MWKTLTLNSPNSTGNQFELLGSEPISRLLTCTVCFCKIYIENKTPSLLKAEDIQKHLGIFIN